MNQQRRDALRIATILSLAVASGLIDAAEVLVPAQEWNKGAFNAKTLSDTVKALGGGTAALSNDILIDAPDIAENYRMVPVIVSTTIPNVQQIAILVEKNPRALVASFKIPAGTEASISTSVKMAQTSNVHALVKADGKWLMASKEIKVTTEDCDG